MVMLTKWLQILVICKLLFFPNYLIVIVVHFMVIKIGVLIVFNFITTHELRLPPRSLQVSWNGVDLENTDTPKYLGVTLDRTFELQDTHTQHQDEGGNSKQPTKEISKF